MSHLVREKASEILNKLEDVENELLLLEEHMTTEDEKEWFSTQKDAINTLIVKMELLINN